MAKTVRSKKRHGFFETLWRYKWLYLMLVPVVVYFLLFRYLPMYGLTIAFEDYNIFHSLFNQKFVGFKVFKKVFANINFWASIKNTLFLNLMTLVVNFPLTIIVSLILNEIRSAKFKRVTQSVLYLPHFISWVVVAGITYLDWMGTKDGGFVFYHGFEGEHFEYNENNVPIPKDADYNKVDKDWLRTDIFLIGNQGYFQTVDEFNQAIAADNPGWESYTIQDYEYAMWGKLLPQAQYMYSPQSALDAQTDITLVNNEWGIKCITCKPEDVQANYDQWMADLESKGNIKKVIEDTQAVYDEVRGGSGN